MRHTRARRRLLQCILPAALLGVSRLAAAATCETPGFVSGDYLALENPPPDLTVADFNGDLVPDIAIPTGSSVVVFLAIPGGGFEAPVESAPTTDAAFLTAGDFNGDGKMDLIGSSSTAIVFLAGNGDGSFDDPVTIANSGVIDKPIAAFLDAGTKLDLLVFNWVGETFDAYLGKGDGTFAAPVSSAAGSVKDYALGKLDGDDVLDLAVAGGDGIWFYKGLAAGAFAAPVQIAVGSTYAFMTVADFNLDGKLDLGTTNGFFLAIFLGNADGTFNFEIHSFASATPVQISLGDWNDDGIPDFAVCQLDTLGFGYGPYVIVQLGNGDGTFGTGSILAHQANVAAAGPIVAAGGDFDDDGREDLAFITLNDPTVTVLGGNGDGSFRAIRLVDGGGAGFFKALASGDFNEDGRLDLVESDFFSGGGLIFTELFGPDGHVTQEYEYAFPGELLGLAAADLNDDTHLDVVTYRFANATLAAFPGLGEGTLAAPIGTPVQIGNTFAALRVGFFDGDAYPDVAIATQGATSNAGEVSIFLGNGDFTFRPGVVLPLFVPPSAMTVADLDGDGHDDLAVVGAIGLDSGLLFIFRGNGDGTFSKTSAYSTGAAPSAIVATQLTDLPIKDLLVTSFGSSEVSVYRGFGNGAFGPPTDYALDWAPTTVAAADFDGDGKIDVVAAGQLHASLFPGLGDGTLGEPLTYEVVANPIAAVTGEFSGNGVADLVLADSGIGGKAFLISAILAAKIPAAPSVIVSSPFAIHVEASGLGFLSYQWRKNGIPIVDGGTISGAQTATLTIDPIAFTDAGSYDVVVSDSCHTVSSNAVAVSVEFDDVPTTNPFHADIIALATSGITSGCGDTSFCPENNVSRAEMAVLLLKAKYGADHIPPSPPPVPIFPDVPADAFGAAWIDELATLNITAGCGDGNGNYCPNDPVTRRQMAVFLLKTLVGADYTPPPAAGVFADVPADDFAIAWIEDLRTRGITAGCDLGPPPRFCPDENVPREQMATFLVRTFLTP